MWFKQNEQKTPQQPEAPAPRPQTPAAQPPAPPQQAEPPRPAPPVVAPPPSLPSVPASSRITSGISLKGEISGREDLWIGGSVDGKLRMESARVVVGASGKVHGEIEAREIVVEGSVEGDLLAAERLEIATSGTVHGDGSAPRIALAEGAVFNGAVEVIRAGESPSAPQKSAPGARTTVAPRGSRAQAPHSASAAAAAAGAAMPIGTPPGVPEVAPESRDSDSAPPSSVLHRGIAADSSDGSD
ncbi:MAG TPA: polymer-forming cytoskeletal protein [Candidatus Acidoferrales bacterium]|nr:polymer-forming cytoskeletal protein [Candidatus Acidoferrales bacterium]